MKICQLRIKNLNSLAGSWMVDFEELKTRHGGLFAITGPTGSGKSTLLDGICLALFGRTPRLKDVNSSGNEIMTRHRGDCLAEVTFETSTGRYRIHWSQRRARGEASGRLQTQRHELSQLDHSGVGTIIESKISQIPVKIQQLCGMDFEQFTRSVFLPQGGFAAFLKASSAERAELLEGLTGTELYAQISKKVHEVTRLQGDELKNIRARKEELLLLTKEERVALTERLSVFKREAQRCESAQSECQHDLSVWLQHCQLEKRRTQYHEKKNALEFLEIQAKDWLPELEADRRGRNFVEPWRVLQQAEIYLAGQEELRRQQTIELQLMRQTLSKTRKTLETQLERQVHHRQKMERQLPLLTQIIQLDKEELQREQHLKKLKENVVCQETELQEMLDQQKEVTERSNKRAEKARQYQVKIQQRKESTLYSSRHYWSQWIDEWKTLYSYGKNNEGSFIIQETAELKKAALHHLRHTLKEGFPCPLCGALKHPSPVESEDSILESDLFVTLTEQMALYGKKQRYMILRDQLAELIRALGSDDHPSPSKLESFWRDIQKQWNVEDEEAKNYEQSDTEKLELEELSRRVRQGELNCRLASQRYGDAQQRQKEQQIQRETLFSGDAVAALRQLEVERDLLEVQRKAFSEALENQNRQERQISDELARLDGVLAEGKSSLSRQKQAFERALKEQQFESCEQWQAALLTEQKRLEGEARNAELLRLKKNLEEEQYDLQRREVEIPPVPDVEQASLDLAVEMHQSFRQKAYETIGQCREALQRDDINRQRSEALSDAEETHRNCLRRWEQLHELIGSADGKKFRSFVQGLSFRVLVTEASQYLQDMLGRYELLPSHHDPLDLEVRDLWQANEIRSVQNLSGGETFMVSLALALALSGTEGLQETLFLDEGFGALDDESLDMVLDALEKLRQRGRVIGVISHVAALRQRISCQIRLNPGRGGHSSISGPACSSQT